MIKILIVIKNRKISPSPSSKEITIERASHTKMHSFLDDASADCYFRPSHTLVNIFLFLCHSCGGKCKTNTCDFS